MAISVKLEAFEGPLDLLLHLIDKNKVNIYDIPIAVITDQYMEYLREMESRDLNLMSEFLLMAATLLNIKARMLLPAEKDENDEEIDPRAELVERLLEYKMYKYISTELHDRQLEASYYYYKGASIPEEVSGYKEEVSAEEVIANTNVTVQKLLDTFHQVMRRQTDKVDPIRSKFGTIEQEEVNLAEKMDYVGRYLKGHSRLKFQDLLVRQKSRTEIVVTFLCVLELMKIGAVTIHQEDLFSDIMIEFKGNEDGIKEIGSSY